MHFGLMNVILLRNDHRHVSVTNMHIFRVVSAKIWIYLWANIFVVFHILPWRWTHGWPKHVGGHRIIKSYSYSQSAFVGLFSRLYTADRNIRIKMMAW